MQEEITNYIQPMIMIGCFAIGFVLKHIVPSISNKYIPAIVAIFGILFNVWMNDWVLNPVNIIVGMISGIASVGADQFIRKTFSDETFVGKFFKDLFSFIISNNKKST